MLAAGLVLAPLLLSSSPVSAGGPGRLTVSVTPVRSGGGNVFVALYDRANWLTPGRFKAYRQVPAHPGTVSATFSDLEPGRYSVAVFHDENANGRVDTNWMGLPSEGFGFSRKTPLRVPSFSETSFEVHGAAQQHVRLRY